MEKKLLAIKTAFTECLCLLQVANNKIIVYGNGLAFSEKFLIKFL